ncbi:MAG: hypothetical protein AAF828_04875 [Bacteroidota bacterium]
MSKEAIGQGLYLAEMINHYHQYRTDYLAWSFEEQPDQSAAILNYQRAILACYEARLRTEQPYTGDVYYFIQVAATHYAGREVEAEGNWYRSNFVGAVQDPIRYLPPSLTLNDTQRMMLQQFQEMGESCRELLLLAYYHQLDDHKLSEVLELGAQTEAASKRRQCLLMVRERWQQTGLLNPINVAPPAQQALIDQYFRHELDVTNRWEVEAMRSSDMLFQEAMTMREDWQDALMVAGRQDTLTTLQREEEEYRPKPPPKSKVTLSRPTLSKEWSTYLAIVLAAVLAWLVFTTFGGGQEEKLYATYYRPFPTTMKLSNGDEVIDDDLADILFYYKQGDYRTAYDDLLPAANAYPIAPLYLGICALELQQPQRALDWFDQFLPGDRFKPYADWYAAMAYLALGRRPATLSILIEIAGTDNHPYERQATELIEALE